MFAGDPAAVVSDARSVSDLPDVPADSFDGVHTDVLRERLGVPVLHLFATAGSTLDIAHGFAQEGAPHGTLVLADAQTRGRGRAGKRWASAPGVGLWLTLIARPATAADVRVLTVRLGLRAAAALDSFAESRIGLKWPNDLYVGGGKLAGVLVEARWRGSAPEWLAIGFGLNVVPPHDVPGAAGLRPGSDRIAVLESVLPALSSSVTERGEALDTRELRDYEIRDIATGRRATSPARGTVRGITSAAELVIATVRGDVACSSGSLVLSEDT